jgi:prepilin-type N-terminal cleavage/methylation domain-containing protein
MKKQLKQKNNSSHFIKLYSICVKRSPEKSKGFTLIELMVSLSIFSIITLAATGSFLVTLNAAKKARALSFAMDNVNYAMESMTRSIRMGTDYVCKTNTISLIADPVPSNCASGNSITFTPQERPGQRVGYMVVNGVLNRYDNSNTAVAIVAPNVRIDAFRLTVKGALPSETIQPSVYIVMRGSITIKGVAQPFAIQTMASQRNFK